MSASAGVGAGNVVKSTAAFATVALAAALPAIAARTTRRPAAQHRSPARQKIGLCELPHSGERRRYAKTITTFAQDRRSGRKSPTQREVAHASHHFHPVLRNCPDLHSGMRLRAKPSARR